MLPQQEARKPINGSEFLLLRPTPLFTPDQMKRYTPDAIFARHAAAFNPAHALEILNRPDLQGSAVLGIDIGGDKFQSQQYRIMDGRLSPDIHTQGSKIVSSKENQDKYIEYLKKLWATGIPIGLSIAGPMDDTRIIDLPNLSVLKEAMQTDYEGDFANIGINAVANDAVAVTMGGSVAALTEAPSTRSVIVGINGGGWGGAVIKDGQIWAAEMGHTEADPMIDPYDGTYAEACGVNGAEFTCLEKMAASGAGIERLWARITQGEKIDGRKIAERLKNADSLAINLYDSAAIGTAMGLLGFAKVFDLRDDAEGTAYVLHGGAFRVPHFGQRVEQILEANLGYKPNVMYTESVSPTQNIGLEGAAIAALMAA